MKGNSISDKDRLAHMLGAVEFILAHTVSLSEDEFLRNELLKRAVVRDLTVIGEAANYLSDELKDNYPEVEWRPIIATRHRIIHQYFHVDYLIVWDIVQNHLPPLRSSLKNIISAFP